MSWMSIAIAAVATLVIQLAPRYGPYIVASGLMHIVYNVTLVRSYRRNDLSQAYPIGRGSSPLLVIARWRPGLDRGVWHRDMSVAVGRDGRGIGFARDQCGVCGADRTNVSAGSGQWKTLARVRDRRGWGGLFAALTLPKG